MTVLQRHYAPPRDRSRSLARAGAVGVLLTLTLVVLSIPQRVSPTAIGSVVHSVVHSVMSWSAHAASALTWPVISCVIAVSALHYVAAAASARAAAGVRLPFRELVAAQFVASAANRLTPAGLGGATVLGRYFVRRGGMNTAQAAAAVSALTVLGSAADVAAFAALIAVGTLAGLAGASGEVPLLIGKLAGLVALPSGTVWWVIIGVLVGGGAIAAALLHRAGGTFLHAGMRRIGGSARSYGAAIGTLVRRPTRLAVLMGASAATTLLLAAGFAAAATLGVGGLPVGSFVALMIGYMVASAAGNALPTPGGIGTADAALIGVLVAAHMATAPAVATVLAFRLITFWAPAVAGAALVRPLRRTGAL